MNEPEWTAEDQARFEEECWLDEEAERTFNREQTWQQVLYREQEIREMRPLVLDRMTDALPRISEDDDRRSYRRSRKA